MSELQKSLQFKVGENSYVVSQPNIGQVIDIEMMKSQITNGNYGKMITNYSKMSILSLDMIDMFAHFKVICPKLLEDLKVDNWSQLDSFDALDLFKAYQGSFKPWFSLYSDKLTKVWEEMTSSLVTKDVDQKEEIKDESSK